MDKFLYTLIRFGGYSLRTETPHAPAPRVEIWRDSEVIAKLRLPMTPTDFVVGENGVAIAVADGEGKYAVTWQGWRDGAPITDWHYAQVGVHIGVLMPMKPMGVVAVVNTRDGALVMWAGGHRRTLPWYALVPHGRALVVVEPRLGAGAVVGVSYAPFASVKPILTDVTDWTIGSRYVKTADGARHDVTEIA